MKTEKNYFYLDNTTQKRRQQSGILEEYYTVIKVNTFNGNVDEADRKARTIANKLNLKLAGGYFAEACKPYNFKSNYTVINCPDNTKIDPYNDHDKFIINLIEQETA